jgi:hypothetical protein
MNFEIAGSVQSYIISVGGIESNTESNQADFTLTDNTQQAHY